MSFFNIDYGLNSSSIKVDRTCLEGYCVDQILRGKIKLIHGDQMFELTDEQFLESLKTFCMKFPILGFKKVVFFNDLTEEIEAEYLATDQLNFFIGLVLYIRGLYPSESMTVDEILKGLRTNSPKLLPKKYFIKSQGTDLDVSFCKQSEQFQNRLKECLFPVASFCYHFKEEETFQKGLQQLKQL